MRENLQQLNNNTAVRTSGKAHKKNNETIPKFLSAQIMRPPGACDNQVPSSLTQPAHSPVQTYNKKRAFK